MSILEMVVGVMLLKTIRIRMSRRLVEGLLDSLMDLEETFRAINRAQSMLLTKKSHIK
jgi:hypothetical protein